MPLMTKEVYKELLSKLEHLLAGVMQQLIVLSIFLGLSTNAFSQDVRFLVDESGSMRITDPQRLTIPALDLITHLLPSNNVAGIWGFSSTAREIVPLGLVTKKWQDQTKLQAKNITFNGQFTNIGRAIEVVSKDWFDRSAEQERIIILLTDGKIDIDNNKASNITEKQRVLEELIPKLKQHHITVYAIGLSNNIDKSLLKELTYQTNGTFQILQSPEQLQDSFYAIFNAAVDSNEVPIINNQFKMDNHITEVTLLLMKPAEQAFSIIMPDGQAYPLKDARVFVTPKYTFVTIKKPATGLWRIQGFNSNKNRAIILSDLGLATRRFNQSFFAGERIVTFAYLTNHGDRLTNELTIKNTDITITTGDSKAITLNKPTVEEINYRKAFYLPQNVTGGVTVTFDATSKTFERQKKQLAHIDPFPFKISFRRRNGYEMQVYISTSNTNIISTNIIGEIKYPANKATLQFKPYGVNKYFANYVIGCVNEHYTAVLDLSGKKLNGDNFQFNPIEFNLECRQKPMLHSYIESTDTNQMVIKRPLIQNIKKKKEKNINYMSYLTPIFSTLALLSLISALFLQVRSYKRRKMLESILDGLQNPEDEEEEQGDEGKNED